ncbi:unnamed protein product [Protopolystoma xenopodis]|uniref:Uncharacterized protein n=1 Tax=Protopolystoma xenopodis TaxID=117903 RepID=A0A3S5FGX6_9PLAT|nr:unnamed protein product [Protopolystoma xenopodis]
MAVGQPQSPLEEPNTEKLSPPDPQKSPVHAVQENPLFGQLPSDRAVRFAYANDPSPIDSKASKTSNFQVKHPRPEWFPIDLVERKR